MEGPERCSEPLWGWFGVFWGRVLVAGGVCRVARFVPGSPPTPSRLCARSGLGEVVSMSQRCVCRCGVFIPKKKRQQS